MISAGVGSPLNAAGTGIMLMPKEKAQAKGGRWGCANACVGGGQGVATVIERQA